MLRCTICQKLLDREFRLRKHRKKKLNWSQRKERHPVKEKLEVENLLEEIEGHKDDSTKCYAAIRKLQQRKPKTPLIIKDKEDNVAGSSKAQADIITDHFL